MKTNEMVAIAAIAVVAILIFYFITAKGPARRIAIVNEANTANASAASGTSNTTNKTIPANNTSPANTTNKTSLNNASGGAANANTTNLAITNPDASFVYVDAEIADNMVTRAKGLMGRKSLGENQGMLFVFDSTGLYPFWMLNTSISLDAIFIAENGTVVDIIQMEPCGLNPTSCPRYIPKADSRYVLEVNKGFAERHGIAIGKSRLKLPY